MSCTRFAGMCSGVVVKATFAIRLLGTQRIGGVSALRHRLPFEQGRRRALEHRLRRDRHWPEFRAPLGHFHYMHRKSSKIKTVLVVITVIISINLSISVS